MKLKKKKKLEIPKNINQQNIDLFNQALNQAPSNGVQGQATGLSESANTQAWMVRNDGKVFEIPTDKFHPYTGGDYEETIYGSQWLFDHTNSRQIKKDILKFIVLWVYEETDFTEDTIADQLRLEQSDRPYYFISDDFLNRVADKLEKINLQDEDLDELDQKITDQLNNEFMRVRAGGAVNSDASLGDLYFRISSKGFNWFNIIWKFVYDRQHSVDTVTILKDDESTGSDEIYSHNGKSFDRMPTEEFIMMKGNPVVESMEDFFDNYEDWQLEEAYNALRDDFVSDSAMLEQFFDWSENSSIIRYIKDKFGITADSKFTEEQAAEVVDEYLPWIAKVLDEPFLKKFLIANFGE